MIDPIELLRHLADGAFYSEQELASRYGMSRHMVYQSLCKLKEFGVYVERAGGCGYRLSCPIDLLESQSIRTRLKPDYASHVSELEVFPSLDSTNSYLLRRAAQGAPRGALCLAEYQTSGKGRRGRRWVSPFGSNLYLSLLWRFDHYSAELSGLSLLVGLTIAELVRSLGGNEVCLKWPNDILFERKKLGGVLLELSNDKTGGCYVVIGVGFNVSMPLTEGRDIEQPWTDMASILAEGLPSRNRLAAGLAEALLEAVLSFEARGLEGLPHAWRDYDCLHGSYVTLNFPSTVKSGRAIGIDSLGRLRLERDGMEEVYSSGEISLRVDA